jgi:hypothetical protein
MKYLKYTQYVYLLAAVFFLYQGFEEWNNATGHHWLFLIIAVVCLFMFYFRRKFAKKFDNRDNNKQ